MHYHHLGKIMGLFLTPCLLHCNWLINNILILSSNISRTCPISPSPCGSAYTQPLSSPPCIAAEPLLISLCPPHFHPYPLEPFNKAARVILLKYQVDHISPHPQTLQWHNLFRGKAPILLKKYKLITFVFWFLFFSPSLIIPPQPCCLPCNSWNKLGLLKAWQLFHLWWECSSLFVERWCLYKAFPHTFQVSNCH